MRWLLLLALFIPVMADATMTCPTGATCKYVRPANDGNGTTFTYGSSNGTSEANAFEGFADMSGITAGDTICMPGSDEPFFERLDTGTAGTSGAQVTYRGCSTTKAVIWYAQGLSGNRSFDSSRVLINTATYAWTTVGTDTYRKRIDVRPRMLWEGSTWLTPQDCNASTEAAAIAALTASHWCVRDNGDSTYWILYHATAVGNSPTNTVIRCEYVPYSDGSTVAMVRVDLDWQTFRNLEVRGVSASSSSRSLYIVDASNITLDTMTFSRNKEGPSIIPATLAISNITWSTISVLDTCETSVFISPIVSITNLLVTDSEFSRTAGTCYNGSGFTAGDGDGFAIGQQAGGTVTDVVVRRIVTNDNVNAGIFVGTVNPMTVTNFEVFGWTALRNGRNCFSEGSTSQIGGRFALVGFLCQGTLDGTIYGSIFIGTTPPAVRTITIANGTFAGNANVFRILFSPHADNNYTFRNLVFYTGGAAGDTRDFDSRTTALVGDEVFDKIYFYSTPNGASRFAKLNTTSYYYNVGGALTSFNTATSATGTVINTDPLLSGTYQPQALSPLRLAGTVYAACIGVGGVPCTNPPTIGGYQVSSGTPVTTRTAITQSRAVVSQSRTSIP